MERASLSATVELRQQSTEIEQSNEKVEERPTSVGRV